MAVVRRESCECRYDVFLSFRGEDTRKTFTDHLHTALVNAGLSTFRDEDELERGEHIRVDLHKAIQQSRTSVIVFSKDYASSRWCLDELIMILERRNKTCGGRDHRHVVLPVFYDVDPSDLRKQTGSLAKAFSRHQKMEASSKVDRWREALREVADLSGMVLQNQADRHEAKFIKKIVKVVADKLSRTPLSVSPNLVGILSRFERIDIWLQDESIDVGILVIYGIGGIGKTTIAKLVYNLNFEKFDGSSFLENIRQFSEQPNGLVWMQTKLLLDIGKKAQIHSVSEGISKIEKVLRSKRVLLVIDDVDDLEQLEALLMMHDKFCRGSRIIITTRHARLLHVDRAIEVYKLETLDFNDALKLFSWHAFGRHHPKEGYMELSERLVHHSGGLPLALKVFGSSLSRQSIDVWESALQKLEVIPNGEIMKKLKISYDSLQDRHDKDLFLHIACFFVGKDRDYIVGILDGCEFYTVVGIQNLIDRCLVTIDGDNKVQMHQMIRDMGRGIVLLESNEPGERSRLCHPTHSFKVLAERNGTKKVEGLVLDMHKHPAFTLSRDSDEVVLLETKGFVGMHNLKMLQLSHVKLTGSYEELPPGLRWLCWSKCTLASIPSGFSLDNLVVLEMHYSGLRKVGRGSKYLPSLKVLDLSCSGRLTEITDFAAFPILERLILKDCASLVGVHQSIEKLERLVYLNLEGCKTIQKLPENISMLNSLETLIISGCSNLHEFPVKLRMLKSLKVLQTNDIPISLLVTTEARSCPKATINMFWASLPSTLVDLSLVDCNLSDNVFPRALANLSSLKSLNLSRNPMHSLPSCIRDLTRLDQLSFSNCKKLKSLIGLPRVGELMVNNCTSLEKISSQSLSDLPQSLGFCGNEGLVEIEPWYKLEPLEKVDEEMINLLALTDLDPKEEITLHTIDEQKVDSGTMYPLQGLYEFGIFHTFLPGDQVPGYYSHKSNGTSISFTIPLHPDRRIRGLNVFSVYENSDDVSQLIYTGVNLPNPIITKVINKSKGLKWIFGPTFYGIPDNGKDMIWLSHWKLENQLEGNNKVTVSVFMEPWLQVKQCGVELVYEQERKSSYDSSDPYSYVIGTGFSEEQEVMPGTYFLCPRPASMENLELCRSIWFTKLIRDSEETDKEGEQEDHHNKCCSRSCKILIMALFVLFFLVTFILSQSSHGEL
ncbi:disease resistance protein RUN1-like isoform X2 [Argentina anserina]|uniref:disease resistance protein RUN1-like isoform X2 n=1 Tax=Argentina anserina TaxID=57926 RepID=UPI0021768670|nr:disease resistance protein RUN1-like isoform X2 [Potentilla anserina]